MPDVLAIVSAALFDKARDARGRPLRKGSIWPTDAYVSTHKAIAGKLTGDLWLVTVRDEALWLVAVLERPRHDGRAWKAAANVVPVVDITELASELEFDTGSGVNCERMAMSLQTPRGLTAGDVARLKAAAAGSTSSELTDAELDAAIVKIPPPCWAAPRPRCAPIATATRRSRPTTASPSSTSKRSTGRS